MNLQQLESGDVIAIESDEYTGKARLGDVTVQDIGLTTVVSSGVLPLEGGESVDNHYGLSETTATDEKPILQWGEDNCRVDSIELVDETSAGGSSPESAEGDVVSES